MDAQSVHKEPQTLNDLVHQLDVAGWDKPSQEVTAVAVQKLRLLRHKRRSADCSPKLPKTHLKRKSAHACAKPFAGCVCFMATTATGEECVSPMCINKAINRKTKRLGSGGLFASPEVRLEKYNKLGLYREALKELHEPLGVAIVSKNMQRRSSAEVSLLRPRVPFQSAQFRDPGSPRSPSRRPFQLQRLDPLSFSLFKTTAAN